MHEKERSIKEAQLKQQEKQADYEMVHVEIEKAKNLVAREVQELSAKIEQASTDMRKMYEFDMFDTDYLSEVNKLFSGVAPSSARHYDDWIT